MPKGARPPGRAVTDAGRWHEKQERGSSLGIRITVWVYRMLGRPLARLLLIPIVTYFFVFGRAERRASRDYLQRLYAAPGGRDALGHPPGWRDVYRHIYEFGAMVLDRVGFSLGGPGDFEIAVGGARRLLQRRNERRTDRPVVRIRLTPNQINQHEAEGFVAHWQPLLGPNDAAEVNVVCNTWAGSVPEEFAPRQHHAGVRPPCPQLFRSCSSLHSCSEIRLLNTGLGRGGSGCKGLFVVNMPSSTKMSFCGCCTY